MSWNDVCPIVVNSLHDSQSLFYAFKTSEVDYGVQHYYISVLDCYNYKMFWTRWSTFTMECGTGNIDDNVIRMSWNDVCPIVVNSLHAKSYPGRVAEWKFYDESGKFLILNIFVFAITMHPAAFVVNMFKNGFI